MYFQGTATQKCSFSGFALKLHEWKKLTADIIDQAEACSHGEQESLQAQWLMMFHQLKIKNSQVMSILQQVSDHL